MSCPIGTLLAPVPREIREEYLRHLAEVTSAYGWPAAVGVNGKLSWAMGF